MKIAVIKYLAFIVWPIVAIIVVLVAFVFYRLGESQGRIEEAKDLEGKIEENF